jgi:very-short-patch-repair endonuclease
VDGDQHAYQEAVEFDRRRTQYFAQLGISVLRFSNYDIRTGFENVCMEIHRAVSERCGM